MSTAYAVQGGSRILNATRVDQSGADNADVTNWTKTNDFILAVNINSGGKETVAAQYKLRWRVSGGSFADVAATGAIKFGATNLTNGATIAVGGRKCDSQGADTWQTGYEVEGTALSTSIDLVDEYETEIHFSLSCADAAYSTLYEFELYDATVGASRGTCGATLTTGAAPSDALTSQNISTKPTVAQSTIGQVHVLAKQDVRSTPTVSQSSIGQIHVLTHQNISSKPTISQPTLAEAGSEDALTSQNISTKPTVSQSSIGQEHVLTGQNISDKPTIEQATLAQIHKLFGQAVSVSPSIQQPTIGQEHALSGQNVSATPTVSQPNLAERVDLIPLPLTLPTLLIIPPAITVIENATSQISFNYMGIIKARNDRRRREEEVIMLLDQYV